MRSVLIVDDKEDNLYYLAALLTGHGYQVESAHHGAEALVKARIQPPDLIISDLLMPVMDGYTLLRHWKADPRLRKVPFIVYTATYTEAEDERLAISLGADAFILKPAEPDDFLSRVNAIRDAGVRPPQEATPPPGTDDTAILKQYSETLIRKLEEKSLQLEYANQALRDDIAERKKTEEMLRESEERFRATFEHAAVGIAHVAPDGRFLRVNDKLCDITGFPREELLQRNALDLLSPDNRGEAENARQAILDGAMPHSTVEWRCRRRNGDPYWANLVHTLLRDPQGEPKYFIVVVTDVTERRNLESHILRVQRMESIGTLAGGIAHDLNNVLAPILMSIELLKSRMPDDGSADLLRTLEASAQRGSNLVRQVLSFARGVKGERVPVPILDILHDIQAIVRDTFPKSISFQLRAPSGPWTVIGDPTQLHQIILNLCVNARDAMPSGGTLTIRLAHTAIEPARSHSDPDVRPGSYLVISVSDTGTGIPDDIREKIFEPFFTTKEVGKGTGLGLSTSIAIVRSHGGFITLESQPGAGSSFHVHLPAEPASNASPRNPASPPGLPHGNNELILLVEDDSAVGNVAQSLLRRFGYRTILAPDGHQALDSFRQHQADIAAVITDMSLPIMDGPSLIAALRAIRPGVRIIASSGLHGAPPAPKPETAWHDFIPKPYSAEALLKSLARVLASPDRA